jgi:hypothetical protein
MRKILILLGFLLLLAVPSKAQTSIQSGPTNPTFCADGSLFWNTTLAQRQLCHPANTWATDAGGITSVSSLPGTCVNNTQVSLNLPPPAGGIYNCFNNVFTPDNPNQTVSPLAYGAKWDVRFLFDCTYTISATVNCTGGDASFSAADVGKIAFGTTGGGDTNAAFSGAVVCPQTTIQTVNSTTQIVLANACTATCTPSVSTICPFAYGTADDTTPIVNAAAGAWNNGVTCRALQFPSGAAFFSSTIMGDNTHVGSACMSGNFTEGGADDTSVGPVVFGAGNGATTLIPLPNFTFPCTGGVSGKACVFGIGNGQAHDFSVNGLQQDLNGSTQNVNLFELAGANGNVGACPGGFTGHDLGLSGWGVRLSTSVGLQAGTNGCNGPAIWNINVMKFGALPCSINQQGSGQPFTSTALVCLGGSNGILSLTGSGTFDSYSGSYGSQQGNFAPVLRTTGGTFHSIGDSFVTGTVSNTAYGLNNSGASGTIFFFKSQIVVTAQGAGSRCIQLNGSSIVHFRDTTVTCTGASFQTFNVFTSTTDKIYNDGGNTFNQGGTASAMSGSYISSSGVKGACTGVMTASSTIGLRITGSSLTGTAVVAACTNTAVLDSGVPTSGPRTLQNLWCSVGSAGTTATTCTALVNGSASAVTCSIAGAATTCFDGVHSVALNDGDMVSLEALTGAATTPTGFKAQVDVNN